MRGHRRFSDREADFGIEVGFADSVHLVPETRLVAAGHEARARGAAEWRGGIALREADATGGERVRVRRSDLVVSLEAEFAVAEVVGKQDDDVRLAARLGRGCRDERSDKVAAVEHGRQKRAPAGTE